MQLFDFDRTRLHGWWSRWQILAVALSTSLLLPCTHAQEVKKSRARQPESKFTQWKPKWSCPPNDILREAGLKSEVLSPGGVHTADYFLSDDEVDYLRETLDLLGPWNPKGEDHHTQYLVNGAWMKECVLMCEEVTQVAGKRACPECPIPKRKLPEYPPFWKRMLPDAVVPEDHMVGRVLRRVLQYANNFIYVNGTLHGESKYNGKVYFDHGNVRRNPAHDLSKTEVGMHFDSDSARRCLSAAITLSHSSPAEGGFRTYACPEGKEDECIGVQGERPQDKGKLVYAEGGILSKENRNRMRLVQEVETTRARLVLFLAETPHSVAPIAHDRDVFFVWMGCSSFVDDNTELEGRNSAKIKELRAAGQLPPKR